MPLGNKIWRKKVLYAQYFFCKIYPTIVSIERGIGIKKLQKKKEKTQTNNTRAEQRNAYLKNKDYNIW